VRCQDLETFGEMLSSVRGSVEFWCTLGSGSLVVLSGSTQEHIVVQGILLLSNKGQGRIT
jgi:hypothetical protein